MDKIFHSTFDFLTHALPGFCIFCSFFILDTHFENIHQFLQFSGQLGIGAGVVILGASYVLGFAANPTGRWLYRTVGFRLWNHKFQENNPMFISDKFILIREFSPSNFRYVETWHMFCGMAHNLSVACLFVIVLSLLRIFFLQASNTGFWCMMIVMAAVCFFIFLHQAVRFYKWAGDDLNAAIKALRLEERAQNIQ